MLYVVVAAAARATTGRTHPTDRFDYLVCSDKPCSLKQQAEVQVYVRGRQQSDCPERAVDENPRGARGR